MPSVVTTQVVPRPVFCPIGHGHRDLELAQAVRAGRFSFGGVALDLGVEPDWLGAPVPSDPEWRVAWSKFYYGLDLAAAFDSTGDATFLAAWERLVASWVDQVPVGIDRSDVAGRRIQNWIYAWSRFAAAPAFQGLRPGLDRVLLDSLTAQARHVEGHLTSERNHRTLELYALFVFAVAFPEADPGSQLLDLAGGELFRNLLTDFRPDGVHREGSSHYHLVALRSMLGALENARRFGLALPDGFAAAAERASEFALHIQRPDGSIPALSDGDPGRFPEVLSLAASLFGRPDLVYAASGGNAGTAPSVRHAGFPDGGYWIQRSGWGDGDTPFGQERYLVFDCGPLGDGGHGHYDLLSVEVFAGGRPLVVDPGRFTYEESTPNWRRWFKGTAAHNTVVVDGLDQTPYRRGRPKGPVAQGRLTRRCTADRIDMLVGEATSPCYGVVHTRRVVFVDGSWWLIEDRLSGAGPHRYDLRFHLAPEAQGATGIDVWEGGSLVSAPGLALAFPPGLQPRLEEGWISPAYGIRHAAPVVSVIIEAVAEATFRTLVLPDPPADARPAIRPAPSGKGITAVEIVGAAPGGMCDRLAWGPPDARLLLGGRPVDGQIGWARTAPDGEVWALAAAGAPE